MGPGGAVRQREFAPGEKKPGLKGPLRRMAALLPGAAGRFGKPKEGLLGLAGFGESEKSDERGA